MSWRTWLGADKQDWCDYNLCEYPSMEELCKEIKWQLPAKVFSPDRETVKKFLQIMDEEYYMLRNDFSIWIGNRPNWEDYD